MRQITISGREYNIGYDMNAAIAYERLTGKKAFDLAQFQDGTIEPQLAIGYAMILANNDPANVPDMDEMMRSINNVTAMSNFITAVAKELQEFYKLEPGDPKPKKGKKGNDSKNA